MNTDEVPRTFRLTVDGLPGIRIADFPATLEVGAAATRLLPLRLQVPADAAVPGSHKIDIVIEVVDDPKLRRREKSTFILPKP